MVVFMEAFMPFSFPRRMLLPRRLLVSRRDVRVRIGRDRRRTVLLPAAVLLPTSLLSASGLLRAATNLSITAADHQPSSGVRRWPELLRG